MEHFYQNISGFMSHRNTVMLDLVIDWFPAGGTWVELGSWTGKSAAYCVVELVRANKLGSFYCVDTWSGGEEHQNYDPNFLQDLKAIFLKNIEPVQDLITPVTSLSWAAADQFADESVDFCYVDAGHTYDAVTKDLESWWPKIRSGSYFAGDDYTKGWPEVQRAVRDFFDSLGIRVRRSGRCWIVVKPEAAE